MKKILIFFVSLFLTITSFAIPAWDKPLFKVEKRFWPWVDLCRVYKFQGANLMLQVKLSESWPEDLFITVPVHTYLRTSVFPEVWQWTWVHYNVKIAHDKKELVHILSTNLTYQYNTWPDGQGNDFLDGPEFYVEYFGY